MMIICIFRLLKRCFLKKYRCGECIYCQKPNLSFLKNCNDLITKKLSNSSLTLKKRTFLLFDHGHCRIFSHVCHLIQFNPKRDQVEFDQQKWAFFSVKSYGQKCPFASCSNISIEICTHVKHDLGWSIIRNDRGRPIVKMNTKMDIPQHMVDQAMTSAFRPLDQLEHICNGLRGVWEILQYFKNNTPASQELHSKSAHTQSELA